MTQQAQKPNIREIRDHTNDGNLQTDQSVPMSKTGSNKLSSQEGYDLNRLSERQAGRPNIQYLQNKPVFANDCDSDSMESLDRDVE